MRTDCRDSSIGKLGISRAAPAISSPHKPEPPTWPGPARKLELLTSTSCNVSYQALGSDVQVVDFSGDSGGCSCAFDATRPPSAMVATKGMCDDGTNKAGFALSLSGALSLTKICSGTASPSVAVQLSGTVAVAPQ